jgi:hypothetical protein
MSTTSLAKWLPQLILMEDYNGHWQKFFDVVYQTFCEDFVNDKPTFRGQRLGLKRHPVYDGKSATFWHMISDGAVEVDREPDLRRCERIAWPRPSIENESSDDIKVWSEKKRGDRRILLWNEEASYLVVLNKRNDYILPWTAYTVEYNHEKQKLNRRWEKYKDKEI